MREKNLVDQVADNIKTLIKVEKKYSVGAQIPNEYVLAKKLDVGRGTIREAIKVLCSEGILEIRRGKGTFVISDEDGTNDFQALLGKTSNIADLYEIRLIIEPKAAYYAAQRATDLEITHILEVGKDIRNKIERNEDRTQEEFLFHKLIANATHNELITRLMPIIFQGIGQGVILSTENEMALSSTVDDHEIIMGFLKTRNAEGAELAMKIHILHARMYLNIKRNEEV